MKSLNQKHKNPSLRINTILNIIKTISSIVFPLITFPYVSRVLQPENVGKVNFAQSFISYFSLIAALGLSTYAIRRCAAVKDDKEKLNNLASQFFSINLMMTILAYFFLVITLTFFRQFDAYRWLIVILSTSILFTTVGADWLNSAMEDFKLIAIRTVAFQIVALTCMFIFVRDSSDYYTYAIISVVASSGSYLTNIFYRRRFCKIRFTFQIEWKEHMLPILFLFAMTLSQVIMNNTDVTMIGLIKGDYEVGLYSTAHKVVNIIAQLVQSLAIVVIPRLSIFFAKKDYGQLNVLLRKILNFNISLGLPCVVGVEMLANEIIYIVGGTSYMEAVPIIRLLVLSFMFSLVGGSFLGNAMLIPSGREKYYMVVCLVTAGCNIVLNFILIPLFGAVGASISTVVNGFLVLILLAFKIDKNIKIQRIHHIFVGPIFGCALIVISCLACSMINDFWIRTILSVVSSVLVYFVVLYIFKNEFVITTISWFRNKVMKRG